MSALIIAAYLSVLVSACKDCSSLENNDNVPQGNEPMALLYTSVGFQEEPIGIPTTFVSVRFAPTIRSVQVPTDYELILYDQDKNFGSYIVLSGLDVTSLEEYYFSARMQSLRYSRKTEMTLQHPQIFGEQSYAGRRHFLPFGETELPELTFFGSLKVPAGVTITLTTAIGPRSSKSYDFTSDISVLPFSDPVKSVSVKINLSGEI
jgi:hypothetical protein